VGEITGAHKQDGVHAGRVLFSLPCGLEDGSNGKRLFGLRRVDNIPAERAQHTGVERVRQVLPGSQGKHHLSAVRYGCHCEGAEVKRTIQVRIFRGERQYVAECLDLPVVTEAPTLDELAVNIREAIALHLDGEDLAEAGISPDPTILATMELQAVA
jgi:hypothetical protein